MEWFDMSPRQRQLYINAYKCLYDAGMYPALWTLHSSGPTGTGYPSPFHYGHDHGSGFFYWHRVYSLRFEAMVRQCAANQNITELRCFVGAYWDSPAMLLAGDTTADRVERIRSTFFTDAQSSDGYCIGIGRRTNQCDNTHPLNFLAGPAPNCFTRGPDTDDPPSWEASDLQYGVIASATNMQGLVQIIGKHFAMHPYVGGIFGGVDSSRDGLFFLHHNYYDMLWELWKSCKGKTTWASASYAERWFANNPSNDYNPDGPMQGFNAYPQDVWDNQNLVVRLDTNPPTTTTVSVVYSSSSLTRAQASGIYNCPASIDKYFRASIPLSAAPVSAIQLGEKIALLQKGAGTKLVSPSLPVNVPPHLWSAGNKDLHPESHTEWREHLRRLSGASHRAFDRHVNVLAHTWRAPRSAFGRAAWLETVHQEQPIMKDVGQQCRELAKTAAQTPGVTPGQAALIGLDCECERTDAGSLGNLPSEFVALMRIQDLCLQGGCNPLCPLIQGSVHGKRESEDEDNTTISDNDTGTTGPGASGLIARLSQRLRGN